MPVFFQQPASNLNSIACFVLIRRKYSLLIQFIVDAKILTTNLFSKWAIKSKFLLSGYKCDILQFLSFFAFDILGFLYSLLFHLSEVKIKLKLYQKIWYTFWVNLKITPKNLLYFLKYSKTTPKNLKKGKVIVTC